MSVLDLLIVGAGPAGLAVGIAAAEAQLDYLIVEKGVLVNSVFNFPPGMTFFTTPDLLEIGQLPFVTPYEKPTRHEARSEWRGSADVPPTRSRSRPAGGEKGSLIIFPPEMLQNRLYLLVVPIETRMDVLSGRDHCVRLYQKLIERGPQELARLR